MTHHRTDRGYADWGLIGIVAVLALLLLIPTVYTIAVYQHEQHRRNFHSSDTYRSIEPGQTYRFTTIGFRIPFLSEFPNIVEAEPVSP